MIETNDKYNIIPIDKNTLYVIPNFEICDVKEIISDILKELDSSIFKYIISSALGGHVIYDKGKVSYFNTPTPPIIPFFLQSDEYIDNVMSRMNLAKMRRSAKVTQRELSDVSGLSSQCISNLESDDPKQSPTLRTVLRYINCLGYEISFTKRK